MRRRVVMSACFAIVSWQAACATGVEPAPTVDGDADAAWDPVWDADVTPDPVAEDSWDTDIGDDTAQDPDAIVDPGGDADVLSDPDPDPDPDAPPDSIADTPAETWTDPDVGPDTGVDTWTDTGTDTGMDTVVDPDVDSDPAADDATATAGTCSAPLPMTGPGLYTGDTTGLPADHAPYCSGWQQSSTEQVWLLHLDSTATVVFHLHPTAYWDPSIYVHHECAVTASTTPDHCADAWMWGVDEDLTAPLAAGDWYVFIDGYISSGPYELTVSY